MVTCAQVADFAWVLWVLWAPLLFHSSLLLEGWIMRMNRGLVSGGVYMHPDSTKTDVAKAILQGLRSGETNASDLPVATWKQVCCSATLFGNNDKIKLQHLFLLAVRVRISSWRAPVVLVPGTFCLWFQFFRGGCCSRSGNPRVSCRRGNIWIWWINNMNQWTTSTRSTSSLGRYPCCRWLELKSEACGEPWGPEVQVVGVDRILMKPWKWGGRKAREKMLSASYLLLQLWQLATIFRKEPLLYHPLPPSSWILES